MSELSLILKVMQAGAQPTYFWESHVVCQLAQLALKLPFRHPCWTQIQNILLPQGPEGLGWGLVSEQTGIQGHGQKLQRSTEFASAHLSRAAGPTIVKLFIFWQ